MLHGALDRSAGQSRHVSIPRSAPCSPASRPRRRTELGAAERAPAALTRSAAPRLGRPKTRSRLGVKVCSPRSRARTCLSAWVGTRKQKTAALGVTERRRFLWAAQLTGEIGLGRWQGRTGSTARLTGLSGREPFHRARLETNAGVRLDARLLCGPSSKPCKSRPGTAGSYSDGL